MAKEKKAAEPVHRLQELYARAMALEFEFFAEHWRPQGEGDAPGPWRGIDPGKRVGCVCVFLFFPCMLAKCRI